MTQSGRSCLWTTPGWLAALAVFTVATSGVQRIQAQTTTLKTGISQNVYTDQTSDDCEKQNTGNPYTGMNPLACYGESAPTDSNGQCTLNIGSVWKKVGETCYYCAPIKPPIQGIIVPMDEVGLANQQGYNCGVDQADACMAVCYGGNGFNPTSETPKTAGAQRGPQGGPPPGYAPMPGPAGGIGYTPGPNPCLPFGPGGYDYCQNGPGARLPAGCVCSKTTPKTAQAKTRQSNPVADAGDYLHGVVDGFGVCFKSMGSLLAGAGYFAKGDFVNAAQAWGLSPGQSVVLKTMYTELTTPQINVVSNVTPYQAGVTAGRRLCQYAAIPGVAKAAGTVLKGAVSPGSTFTNPIKGSALQTAIDSSPESIANKWVQTGKGPVQLGGYAGQGSFATVFKYGKNSVIKLSRANPETMGYGPESIEGQSVGAGRLQQAGVETPNTSNYNQGGSGNPASIVADDVTQKYPGSFQLSNAKYHGLNPAQQGEVLNAVTNATDQIAKGGDVLIDVNPGNFTLQAVGNAMKAIIHDPDMVMTLPEIHQLTPTSVRWAVLNTALEVAGEPSFLGQPFTAQSLTNVLNIARQRLITGITNVPTDTVPPPGE